MFCPSCGKNLPDDAKFCDGCGNAIAQPAAAQAAAPQQAHAAAQQPYAAPQQPYPAPQQPYAAPVYTAPAAPNPIFTNFVAALKGFFSKNTVKTVGEAAQSTGNEWLLTAGVCILAYILAFIANMSSMTSFLFEYIFGSVLLLGVLISVCTYFLMSFGIYGAMRLIFKKDVKLQCVFNMVAVASLPLAVAWVANILIGFIYMPLVFVLSVAAFIPTAVLLYVGMQKLDKLESSPLLPYSVVWGLVVALTALIVYIVLNAMLQSALGELIGGIDGMLGGMGDMSDFYY